MISVGKLSTLSDFLTHVWPKGSTAVSMAPAMQMDEMIVDYLVLGLNNQDRKVSAKSMTIQLFKWLQRIALTCFYDDALTELVNHYANRILIVSCTKDYT